VTVTKEASKPRGPHRRATRRRHPSKGRRRSPPSRVSGEPPTQAGQPTRARVRTGANGNKGAENPVQPPFSVTRGRSPGFHSSMPRSNPHARERVMDDRKHLDAVASFVSFAGRETSVVSSAGSSRGSALQTPANRIGDQEVLETQSSWGSPPYPSSEGQRSSTRGSRPVPAMEAVRKDGESRQPHGSLSRPPVAIRTSGTGATANLPVVLPGGENHSGPATIRRRGLDHAPAWPAGVSEEPAFRMGRAHDRFVVAEVGRTASSSWKRAATGDRSCVTKRNAAGGNLRGASDRPPDGRRSGSSVLARTASLAVFVGGGLGRMLADASSLR